MQEPAQQQAHAQPHQQPQAHIHYHFYVGAGAAPWMTQFLFGAPIFFPFFPTPTTTTTTEHQQYQQQQQQQQGTNGAPTWEQIFLDNLYQQYHQQRQQQINKATDKKQLNKLPVYICDSCDAYQAHFGDCHKECTICLCESENKERLLTLPCSHTFHEDCILPWLEKNNSCPTCRYELQMLDSNLERERCMRMNQQYGPEALTLMQLCTEIQTQYSRLQTWNSTSEKSTSQLNSIEADLMQSMFKLDGVIIPSDEEIQQSGRQSGSWDWTRIRQVRKQLVLRIQFLQSQIDMIRASLQQQPQQI